MSKISPDDLAQEVSLKDSKLALRSPDCASMLVHETLLFLLFLLSFETVEPLPHRQLCQ